MGECPLLFLILKTKLTRSWKPGLDKQGTRGGGRRVASCIPFIEQILDPRNILPAIYYLFESDCGVLIVISNYFESVKVWFIYL